MAWGWLDSLLIVIARGDDSDKSDSGDSATVDRFIKEATQRSFTTVLSVSKGSPKANSVQRKELSTAFKGKQVVSVFDGSALTRGVITALGWLGMNIVSFSLKDLDKAIAAALPEGKTATEVRAEVMRIGGICKFIFE
jgi:hypothetical protein